MQKEEDLRRELDLCRSIISQILDSATEGVIGLDPDGNCLFVNRSSLEMLGYADDSLFIGNNLHDLIYCAKEAAFPDSLHACRVMEKVSRCEQYHNSEEELICSDGKLIRVSYSAAPLLSSDGAFIGAIVTIVNTMEKRSLEEQLRQAQKVEAVGTLAGGVAHDFNNILTAIIGFGSLMEMKMAADDPMLKSLQQILSAADRAADLTRSLLAFSKRQLTDIRRIELNRIIKGFEKMLKRLLREDIELDISLCEGETSVMADAGQVEQVLINLATNSRDAMPKGGAISVKTERVIMDETTATANGLSTSGTYVALIFTDSGTGMDENTLSRIFDPQFTTKKDSEGTGLGLSVCYGIIRKHNGSILCESAEGRGTCFTIYLPAAPEASARNDVLSALGHLRGTESILLAEDDLSVLGLSRSTLEQFGYKVVEAIDGNEAVRLYLEQGNTIHLCILDVIMPKKRGVEAFYEIRQVNPNARVLFISGYSEDFLAKQNLPPGVMLLKKPLPPVRLLEAVRAVLDKE